MDGEASPQKGQKNGRPSRAGRFPKDCGHFLLKPLKAVAPGLIPLTPLTLVLMVFWPETVDAEKRLCKGSCVSLIPSFSLSHTLLVSPLLTPLSFLSPSRSASLFLRRHRHRRAHTHTLSLFSIHSFSHYWSVSALENSCASRADVITSGINNFPCA